MATYDDFLTEAQQAYETQDPGEYRHALHALQKAREAAEESEVFFNDGGLERKVRRTMVDLARSELNTLFAASDSFDMDAATAWLDLWDEAIPGAELDQYRARVRRTQARFQNEALYYHTREQVEQLWQQAEKLARDGATASVLLSRYTEARDIARDAHENNPEYAPLEELFGEAEKRRGQASREAEEMLSGFQGRQYVRTLKYLHSLDENAYPAIYDTRGNEIGRRPKQQAIEAAQQHARDYVNSIVYGYVDDARERLDKGEPRSSAGVLGEKDKFNELHEYVPNLLERDLVESIELLEDEIAEALQCLDRAEKRAAEAEEIAVRDALAGYHVYREALLIYKEGAHKSSVVQRARDSIRSALSNELETLAADIEARLNVENTADYFTTDLLQNLNNEVRRIKADYGGIDDLSLSDRMAVIDRLEKDIHALTSKINTINTYLEEIESKIDNNARAARIDMHNLEMQEGIVLLETHPRYDEINSAISKRLGLRDEYARLETFVKNPDDTRAERALEQVRSLAERSGTMAVEFETLAQRLDVHLMLLRIDTVVRSEGYESAIEMLERYQDQAGLPADLTARLADKYAEVRDAFETIGNVDQTITDARRFLQEGDFEAAYNRLASLTSFANYAQRKQHRDLFAEARQKWTQQIINDLNGLKIENPLSLEDLENKLDDLEMLDPQRGGTMRRRVARHEGVQIAREMRERGEYTEANEQLESIVNSAGKDSAYIRGEILKVKKAHLSGEIAGIITKLRNTEAGSQSRRNQLTTLLNLRNEVRDVAERAAGIDRIEYLTWQIDLLLWIAQYSDDARAQRTAFNDTAAVARDLQSWLELERNSQKSYSTEDLNALEKADAQIKIAGNAPQIADVIRNLQDNLKAEADFGPFVRAVEDWREVVGPYQHQLTELHQAYQQQSKAVKDTLREQITTINEDRGETVYEPHTLPLYAKLLVLDNKDDLGLGMLNELPATAQRLEGRVETLRNEIFSNEGTTAADREQNVLDQQIIQVRDNQGYIMLLLELTRRFSRVAGDKTSTLQQTTARLNAKLNSMLNDLTRFRRLVDDFRAYLDAFDPAVGDGLWENGVQIVEARWNTFVGQVAGVYPGLVNHPGVLALSADKDRRKTDFGRLIDQLCKLRDEVAAEHFLKAKDILDLPPDELDIRLLQGTSLYDTYRVQDVLNESSVSAWQNVTRFVEERAGYLKILRDWGEPFAMPLDAPADPTSISPETVPDAEQVVVWSQERSVIDNLIQAGQFEVAARRLKQVIGDEQVQFEGKLTLNNALNQLEHPPLARRGPGARGDYATAENEAGTVLGKRLIRWMRYHRYERYSEWLSEAKARQHELVNKQSEWDNACRAFADAVAKIGTMLNNKGMFGRRDRDGIRAEVRRADTALAAMRRISRNHTELPAYEANKTYLRGKEV